MAALRPERIALYHYAHLPQRFKPQRRIDSAALPSPEDKLVMLSQAIAGFLGHGYQHIGMDHFALPDDSLALAKRQGRLQRNFQGYSTQPHVEGDGDVIGLGVSAIGRVGATYSQNAKTLPEYYAALRQRHFPVVRGLALTADDRLRRDVIMALMCQGRVEFDATLAAHGVHMPRHFAAEFEALAPLAGMGLVAIDQRAITVSALGWYFVRAVAMVFDRHLQAGSAREHFSRVV